jgi:hypothetical protein
LRSHGRRLEAKRKRSPEFGERVIHCFNSTGRLVAVAITFALFAIGFSVVVAVFPRLNGLTVTPKTAVVVPGFALGRGEFANVLALGMVPAVALADLVEVDVAVADIHASAVAAFAVDFDRVKADGFVIDFLAEALASRAPIGLAVLGRIDTVETHAMAASGLVEDRAGVAIFDGNDASADRSPFVTALVITIIRAEGAR